MKKVLFIGAILLLTVAAESSAAYECEELYGCERKICNLRTDLRNAEKFDNTFTAINIKEVLQKLEARCSDDYSLAEDIDEMDNVKSQIVDYEEGIIDAVEDFKDEVADALEDLREGKYPDYVIAQELKEELQDCCEELTDAGRDLEEEIDAIQFDLRQEGFSVGADQILAIDGLINELNGAKGFVENKHIETQKYAVSVNLAGLNETELRREITALDEQFTRQVMLIEKLKQDLACKKHNPEKCFD